MASDAAWGVRTRSTGEILDDAWRLALADAPLLAGLSGLFNVPAAVVLLLLLCQPSITDHAWFLPALAAALLPLTGIGSGACQEALRRRMSGTPPRLGPCLAAAFQRGWE